MSSTIPERREFAWLESAIFTLGRWLRRLHFIMMLVAVTNPLGLQGAAFRCSHTRIFLWRAVLKKRYTTMRTGARLQLARSNLPSASASR